MNPPDPEHPHCIQLSQSVDDTSGRVLLDRLALPPDRSERLTHVESVPARIARTTGWPSWVSSDVRERFRSVGIDRPWIHQAAAAELAWQGEHVVLATGTASGKSLGYLLPAAATLAGHTTSPRRSAAVLYLSPTKALAYDQLRALEELELPGVDATTFDGDSSWDQRDWARDRATYVLTNPDMLHRTLLAGHRRWARFLSVLRYVVVDECHHYRGVFGSHVAQVLRRLRRLVAHYGGRPTFVLASATVSSPAASGTRLTGLPMREVTDDGSPHGGVTFGLWEPPFTKWTGENDAPVRRSVTAETADLLTDLVVGGSRTIAFVKSRRMAEVVALQARSHAGEVSPDLPDRIVAYRSGYLAEERRTLEEGLQDGSILGAATTNALELGVDIAGLDAVLLAGYPGRRSSLWQQAGRAGRAGQNALAILIARDDPLDTYLVRHPEALFGPTASNTEATVLDPDNPHVLRPHLMAAASELPLLDGEISRGDFGPSALAVLGDLASEGLLRRRRNGWYWTTRGRASDMVDIRTGDGQPVCIVESGTGRLLGTVDASASHSTVHAGAVYLHQGITYVVDELDLAAGVALVHRDSPNYSTIARSTTSIRILSTSVSVAWGEARLSLGTVEVTNQVVGYLQRILGTGEVLGETALDLPSRTLTTRAVWWTVPQPELEAADLGARTVPGAAHAAEHASIGLLPLFATCDRWDIGGVSTALHEDTGLMTVFVYDGYEGGAGFAARAYDAAAPWLRATRAAISSCTCGDGCPSCVQSPKCGNGNNPLDKAGAVRLLDVLLAGAPE